MIQKLPLLAIVMIISQVNSSLAHDRHHDCNHVLNQDNSGNMLRGLSNETFHCGRSDTSLEDVEGTKRIIANWKELNPDDSRRLQAVRRIPLYFHIIGDEFRPGVETDIIDTLSEAFEGHFEFDFRGSIVNRREDWRKSKVNDVEDLEMKRITHVGGMDTLNVWFKTRNTGGLTSGDGTFPWETFGTADGATIWNTVGTIENVVVHEIGHWLGLYHIFRGGCDENQPDDGVEDTVRRKSPSRPSLNPKKACSRYSDDETCPNYDRGTEPWSNYMDYTNCGGLSFTDGQMVRAKAFFDEYRKDSCYTEMIGACRSNNSLQVTRFRTSRTKCKEKCDADHRCMGYEYRTDRYSKKCEIHRSTIDYVDEEAPKHKCYRKDFSDYTRMNGACRTNDDNLILERYRAYTEDSCRERCVGNCKGFEYRTDPYRYKCEIHTSSVDSSDVTVKDHSCLRKNLCMN